MITMDNIKLYYYKNQYQQSYQMLCFIVNIREQAIIVLRPILETSHKLQGARRNLAILLINQFLSLNQIYHKRFEL